MDKENLKKMIELDEAAQGKYVVQAPLEEHEAVYEETQKAIELMKQGKFMSVDVQ